MNGQMGGNVGSVEVVVHLLDINDNVPTLEKESVGAAQYNVNIKKTVSGLSLLQFAIQFAFVFRLRSTRDR